jgi:hypothetical protein
MTARSSEEGNTGLVERNIEQQDSLISDLDKLYNATPKSVAEI